MVARVNRPSPPMLVPAQSGRDDILREMVAGTDLIAGIFPRVLPQTADDVLREVDYRTYEQMMHDPKVAGSVLLLVASVVADGYQLTPSILGEDRQPDKDAQATKEFCERCLKGLPRPLKQTLGEMLKDALKHGNKVAVVTYKNGSGVDKGKLVFHSIKPKPRRAFRFVVDVFRNLYGILPTLWFGAGSTGGFSGMSIVTNLDQVVKTDRLAVLTLNSEDGDPRGMAHLRPSYNAWNLKCNVWPQFLLWLMNEAVPGLIAVLAEGAPDEPKVDDEGKEVKDAQGNAQNVTAAEAAVARLQQFRNAFAAAFPFGTKITQIESKGEGGAFKNSIQLLNAEITEGILFQNLATSEGEHQARAAAQSHMSILDLLIFSLKGVLEDMLYGVLKELVRVNQGDDAAERLTPTVSLGSSERRNFAVDLAAYADAYAKGFIKDDQLPSIHAQLGLEPSSTLIQEIAKGLQPDKGGQDQSGNANQPPDKQQPEKGKAQKAAA